MVAEQFNMMNKSMTFFFFFFFVVARLVHCYLDHRESWNSYAQVLRERNSCPGTERTPKPIDEAPRTQKACLSSWSSAETL